jgi:transposase
MNQKLNEELDIFQAALNIEEPWFVSYRQFDQENKTLHIYLNYRRGAKFSCPHCGKANNRVHDIVNQDRTWKHLDFWEYETILHARLPRIKCSECNKILTVVVDWSRPKTGFTWKFESHVLSLMKEMPVLAVARQVREHDTRLSVAHLSLLCKKSHERNGLKSG